MKIKYEQITADGTWSSGPIEVVSDTEARQGVVAGFFPRQPRRAVEIDTGRHIYGLDAKGAEVLTGEAWRKSVLKRVA